MGGWSKRRKLDAERGRRIEAVMELEELPPNKPKFGLIVALSAVIMLIFFVVAYCTLDWDGKRFVPHHHSAHPTSRLEAPRLTPLYCMTVTAG